MNFIAVTKDGRIDVTGDKGIILLALNVELFVNVVTSSNGMIG